MTATSKPGAPRDERDVRQLQSERDRQLAVGRLRMAAELTTWIDELMSERPHAATVPATPRPDHYTEK
ncbi:MAG TPA: hypothetical protein VFY45_07550 [Baekduia sp.]|nr:hypothetical protein [Baekduia sp.]